MNREERLLAANKCAAKYVHEEDRRIARCAFMDGCEFEGHGELIKGEVLEVKFTGEQVLDAEIDAETDGAGFYIPNGYLTIEPLDCIDPSIFKRGDKVKIIIKKEN